MAKIDKIKFELKGKQYEVGIYVGKSGEFKAEIPYDVQQILALKSGHFTSSKKDDLLTEFYDAFEKYNEDNTKRELFIHIVFKVSGLFTTDIETGEKIVWNRGQNKNMYLEQSWVSSSVKNALGLDYKIVGKETQSNGVVVWQEVEKFDDIEKINDRYKKMIVGNFYFLDSHIIRNINDESILIPYSEKSVETLDKAINNFHRVSTMLLRFFLQDKEKITAGLLSSNLLGITNSK